MIVICDQPYQRQVSLTTGPLSAWRCGFCPCVRLTINAIRIHVAVEHGVRPLGAEQFRYLKQAEGMVKDGKQV